MSLPLLSNQTINKVHVKACEMLGHLLADGDPGDVVSVELLEDGCRIVSKSGNGKEVLVCFKGGKHIVLVESSDKDRLLFDLRELKREVAHLKELAEGDDHQQAIPKSATPPPAHADPMLASQLSDFDDDFEDQVSTVAEMSPPRRRTTRAAAKSAPVSSPEQEDEEDEEDEVYENYSQPVFGGKKKY